MDKAALIKKYNVPVPRYTSYPTVPMWDFRDGHIEKWLSIVQRTFKETNQSKGISIYIHLPFCESLCTYCGCTKMITKNHKVEDNYIESLLREWSLYLQLFNTPPRIRQIHLGGGTPTFFSPDNLERLLRSLLKPTEVVGDQEFSFEGHPNNTTSAHLEVLAKLGFNRLSLGVQDFDIKVQTAINRIQPYKSVVDTTTAARENGYHSINYDLIYGLPYQSIEVIKGTFTKVLELKPERIAFYSYAHVPWKQRGQRLYSHLDLPDNEYKRKLYETGRDMLLQAGYKEIGMDHFALPHDDMYLAHKEGHLHRNFMGYTVSNTDLLIGLGVSSISDSKYAYSQNTKKIREYERMTSKYSMPVFNGHILSQSELQTRKIIQNIIIRGKTTWDEYNPESLSNEKLAKLREMQNEGLLIYDKNKLEVTAEGMAFVRNICAIFDASQKDDADNQKRFSKAI